MWYVFFSRHNNKKKVCTRRFYIKKKEKKKDDMWHMHNTRDADHMILCTYNIYHVQSKIYIILALIIKMHMITYFLNLFSMIIPTLQKEYNNLDK